MAVSLVLFDADGVIQEPSAGWEEAWRAVPGRATADDEFRRAISAVEGPFLEGGDGFTEALQAVLDEFECSDALADVLRVWRMIDPHHEALNLVERLRAERGVEVGLATNQQQDRAAYMRKDLGYDALFDYHFISCEMGVAKPAVAYFERIVASTRRDPGDLLFIDDHERNVAAAREVGLAAEVFHLSEGIGRLGSLLGRHGIEVGE